MCRSLTPISEIPPCIFGAISNYIAGHSVVCGRHQVSIVQRGFCVMCVSKSSLLILLAVLFVAPVTSLAQEKPQLEIAGFSLSKKDPNSEFGQGLSRMRSPGLEVDVYFQLPGETVLSLDNKASNIVLKTNAGTELPLAEMFDGNFNMSPGENASVGIVSMKSEELPGKKTTQLKIDGTFVFNVGRDLKSADAELKLTVKSGPDVRVDVGANGYFCQIINIDKKERFKKVTHDKFFLAIEASDPKYSETEIRKLLESAGSKHIELVED